MPDVDLTPYVPRVVLPWRREAPDALVHEIEGTMVFADISGFTALSERLSRRGKEGAEILTDVISDTFTELLVPPYEVGGSLLKFGGDALLLFFEGDEHQRRACYAASGMRRRLRGVASPGHWAGSVRLRMSVGIHSGDFHVFVVGESHHELVVAGPGATRTCEMEGAASAGEILLSPETVAAVPRSWLGAERAGGRRLSRPPPRPTSGEILSARRDAPSGEVRRFIPAAVRRHLEGGGHEAEHRLITTAFLRCSGLDRSIEEDGPQEVAERVAVLVTRVQEVADEHGVAFLGSDVYEDGFKMLLAAGAPTSSEDDEERLLHAMSSLDLPAAFPYVRTGLHRGYVFSGDVGPSYRRTYTVMGDAVNTAARVMQHARPGTVLSTDDVLRRSSTVFEAEEIPPFEAKGKARSVRALVVGRPTGKRRPSDRSHDGPFIGRDEELSELIRLFEGAREGRGGSVEILGAGGIGKSRLVAEAIGGSGIRSIEVRAVQYEAETPYAVFRRILLELMGASEGSPDAVLRRLRSTVRRVAPELEPWIPLLAIPLGLDVRPTPEVESLDERYVGARMRDTVTAFVLATVKEPTCLCVESAHWTDDASRALVASLAMKMREVPLALVTVARPEGGSLLEGVERTHRIELSPLTVEEGMTLARSISDRILPQRARALAERAEGNPLFLVHLALETSGFLDDTSLPESLESLGATKLDELAPVDRELLRAVSVLGTEFPWGLMEATADDVGIAPEAALGRLDAFLERRDGIVRFRQALYQEVAYEGLPYRRRRRLHLSVGESLEEADSRGSLELCSLHFHLAGDAPRSWRYSMAAGRRAWEAFAFSEAASFFQRAVDAGRRMPDLDDQEMARAWHALGRVVRLSGAYEEAGDVYRRARRSLSGLRGPFFARLCVDEANVRELQGRYEQALRWYGKGLRTLPGETDDPDLGNTRVRLLAGIANVRYFQGRYRECAVRCSQALAQANRISDAAGIAITQNILFLVAGWLEDMDVHAQGEQAITAARKAGNPTLEGFVLNNLGELAHRQGDWTRALQLYEAASGAMRSGGDVVGSATIHNNIAEILSDQGQLDEAWAGFQEAKRTANAAGFAILVHVVEGNLGRLAAKTGDFQTADNLLPRAANGLQDLGVPFLVDTVRSAVAEAFILRGKYGRALKELDGISEGPVLERLRGYALLGCGAFAEARTALEASLSLAEGGDSRYDIALAHEALGRLARLTGENPSEHEAKAQEIFDELGVVQTPDVPLPETARA